jgi:hypothetical protein
VLFKCRKEMTTLIMAWYNAGKDKLEFVGDITVKESREQPINDAY